MRAVTDAGPLIHLSWIDRLELLPSLFDELITPVAVRDEVLRAGLDIPGAAALHDAFASGWPTVQRVVDVATVEALKAGLDQGEAEAIALMFEVDADVVLVDERRARHYAAQLGLLMTGTLGILRTARDRGLVSAVLPLLNELRQRGFRISNELVEEIRREEGRPEAM